MASTPENMKRDIYTPALSFSSPPIDVPVDCLAFDRLDWDDISTSIGSDRNDLTQLMGAFVEKVPYRRCSMVRSMELLSFDSLSGKVSFRLISAGIFGAVHAELFVG